MCLQACKALTLACLGKRECKICGNFIPGSFGADWPYTNGQDLNRLKTQEQRAEENNMLWEHSKIILNRTSWKSLSWSQVNCCQRLVDKPIWPSLERAICISSSLQMHMCGTPNRPCARASIRAMEEAGSTSHAVAQTLSQGLRGKTLTAARRSVRNRLVADQSRLYPEKSLPR